MAKKCLVIGGGSDIGREAVIAASQQGYDVIWTYRNSDIANVGTKFRCDIREQGDIDRLFEMLGAQNIDLCITASFPFIESDNFNFDAYLEVERILRGHVYALTQVATRMSGGKIFNVLGQCVERGLPGGAFYSAAFAFLHNWANSINGREGKTGKVSVCDLLLGPVDTREWSGLSEEVVARYKAKVQQFISPRQVAETILFLASQPVLPSTFKLDAYYGY